MDTPFLELWKLINLGLIFDWEKKVITVRLGPLNIEKIPIPTLKAVANRPSNIEPILSDLFVARSVMWVDLTAEDPDEVLVSLKELSENATEFANKFDLSSKEVDQTVGSILRAWANASVLAAKGLNTAIRMESDPADTGMDTSVEADMDKLLVELRTAQYPAVEFLAALLPETNPIRQQALNKLNEGKETLTKYYGISHGSIPVATGSLDT